MNELLELCSLLCAAKREAIRLGLIDAETGLNIALYDIGRELGQKVMNN